MPGTVLATKLFIPPAPPHVVPRAHLLARLNAGLHRKLILLAAPAGCGKTTLLSAWVAGCRRPVAWLSLDAGDSDPARFLTYLVAALQTIAPQIGEGVAEALQSSTPLPTEALLTALLNDLTTLPHPFLLVLDDYHVITAPAVDEALTFLLEHLPPQMHLVLASREDPPLPLARLRARDQLTELRATDLRFSPTEAAGFLQAMDLHLAADEAAALAARTEGWIAGLQLAALSLQGHPDVPGFIQAFAGDHRYIADYLVAEVLQRQPEPVRNFLLQTAILERLHGPLCDAVTGQQDGQARLEALERGNFFIVPLDDARHWYRYHHLFADVLHAHLRAEQPDLVATLHRRAAAWYAQHGAAAAAIGHALAAADFAHAADLVERALPAMLRNRQEATLLGWLKALPDALISLRPVLSVGYAHALLVSGELAGVEDRLRDAERWLDPRDPPVDRPARPAAPEGAMVVVDEDEFGRLPGAIALARAGRALTLGDVAGTVKYARQARDLVPEDDHLRRGSAAALLGLASWTSGDLEAGHRSYAEGMAHLQRAGNLSDVLGCSMALADIRIAQGRLPEAKATYERGLQLATPRGAPVLRGAADMYVGLSELQREQNDLPAATEQLLHARELGEHTGLPQNPYRWRVAMARIREAQGDPAGALALLQEAERLYVGDFFPQVQPVAAWACRVWVAQGRLGDALGWARQQGLSAEDDLSYLREFEHLTLARLLLARHTSDGVAGSLREAVGLLERLLQAAEAGARTGSVIEILVLQALAQQTQGDIPAALTVLERALALAEPAGYVRIFVDEGAAMAELLRTAAARGIRPTYTGRLLAAAAAEQPASAGASPRPAFPATPPLGEPLSQRELAVLRLFATELSGPEIAQALVIGLSTVRTHSKSIYSKLNVTSRRAAVNRATELGLL